MNKSKALFSALALAAAAVGSQAYAADISTAPQTIELIDGSASFKTLFTGNNADNTFTDRYSFSATPAGTLTVSLASLAGTDKVGLDITGLSLYGSSGLVLAGTQLSTGATDQWTLTTSNLAADNYYLMVSGTVVSRAAGQYGLEVGLAPVPEPETYGMMLGGLGLLGFMARRRNKAQAAA